MDFGMKKRGAATLTSEQKAIFDDAGKVRPNGTAARGVSREELSAACRAAAAETGFMSRDPRPVYADGILNDPQNRILELLREIRGEVARLEEKIDDLAAEVRSKIRFPETDVASPFD